MFIAIPLQLKESRARDTVPVVNGLLIAVNVLVFWLGAWHSWYVGNGTGIATIVTYAFVHISPWHLVGNMWFLWVFGNAVNRRIGNSYYLLVYMGTVLTLGMFAWVFCGGGIVGASGAIFAVLAVCALLLPAAQIDIGYVALFPFTVLIGLLKKPLHWVFWVIRWDRFDVRAWWGLLLLPVLELWSLFWCGWNWTNLGHLLGFICGIAAVLLLPTEISMNRRRIR